MKQFLLFCMLMLSVPACQVNKIYTGSDCSNDPDARIVRGRADSLDIEFYRVNKKYQHY